MKPTESKRVALDRKVVLRFPDFDGFVTEYATNLSMTGMFVRSDQPQEPGTPVAFELRLEDGAPLVRGSGWVVWARAAGEESGQPAGMGIEFTELDHKSRRLVRWMILHQLPEGRGPFDVHAGKVEEAATAEVRGRGARSGPRLLLVVVFAALVALAAWAYWSGGADRRAASPGPPPDGVAAPATPSSGVADGAQVASKTAAPAAVARPPASTRAESGSAAAVAAVEATVADWAAAWSSQDVARYLSHYAADFEPADGLGQAEWRRLRTERLTAPRSIRVAVTRLETRFGSSDQARVSFLQTYRSDGYSDTVDKVMELERFGDGWKIRREIAD